MDENIMKPITVNIPEGRSGQWYIKKITGDSSTIYDLAYEFPVGQQRTEEYGNYTFLCHDVHGPIMQDTFHEYEEHKSLWIHAKGNVLIGGLGIGFVNQKLMENPNITSITIVEKNQDVINLVWDHCPKDARFTLIHADVDTWIPPENSHWDYAWFDTWMGDVESNMEDYTQQIHNRYNSYCDNIGVWKFLDSNCWFI